MENTFFRIRITSLIPDRPTTFNLYLLINGRYILYLHAGDTLTSEKITKLDAKRTDAFFVPEAEKDVYRDYVTWYLQTDEIRPERKAHLLRESSFSLVEELFEKPDVGEALNSSKETILQFVDFMDSEPEAMSHLIGLSTHDFYTYNHSLDVSIYSLGLGRALKLSAAELQDLGQGALFHDIGKRHVSIDIICKKGPLSDEEWDQMRLHPTYGLKILSQYEHSTDGIKAACFEHHENFLGNGYPQGIRGHDIHLYGRIVALSDCYDAMTTQRSYNSPLRPTQALVVMRDKIADKFDPELLKAMHSVLFQLELTLKKS